MIDHPQPVLFSGYIDQELSRDDRERLEIHISMCADCREQVSLLRATKARLSAAPRRALPPDLLEAFERQTVGPSWFEAVKEWWRLPQVRVAAQAMAAAAVVFSVWLGAKGFVTEETLPLEPLLAAHSRYAAEGLVPPGDLVASNFSDQLAVYHAQ